MKKIMAVLCLLVICVTCIPVYGTLTNYSGTIPKSGHSVVATGSKTNDRNFYRNSIGGDNKKEFTGWIEMKNYNTWTQVTDKTIFYPGKNYTLNYYMAGALYTPPMGSELRFKISKVDADDKGGESIFGTINFE